jgi:hypothetical protein
MAGHSIPMANRCTIHGSTTPRQVLLTDKDAQL